MSSKKSSANAKSTATESKTTWNDLNSNAVRQVAKHLSPQEQGRLRILSKTSKTVGMNVKTGENVAKQNAFDKQIDEIIRLTTTLKRKIISSSAGRGNAFENDRDHAKNTIHCAIKTMKLTKMNSLPKEVRKQILQSAFWLIKCIDIEKFNPHSNSYEFEEWDLYKWIHQMLEDLETKNMP